jgi:molybdate transport system regulatory protein
MASHNRYARYMGAAAQPEKHEGVRSVPDVELHDRRRRQRARKNPRELLPRVRAGHRVFFHEQGEPLFGPGTFDLLVLVDETGSLHQAAKLMGMSYNKAWRAMRQAEDHLGIKLLARRTGGSDGGGSVLTDDGVRLMERFRAFLDEADADLARLYEKYFGDASFAQPVESTAATDGAAQDGADA